MAKATQTTALSVQVKPIRRRKAILDQVYPQQAEEANAELKF